MGEEVVSAPNRSGLCSGGGEGGNFVCRWRGAGGVGLLFAAYIDAGNGDCLYDAAGGAVGLAVIGGSLNFEVADGRGGAV